jgi:polyhydroxybutyrate depolymerase
VLPAVTPKSTTIDATLTTPDGRVRTYHLHVPSTVSPGSSSGPAAPLLVTLHGGVGSGTQFEKNSGFDGLAEANRFIVVYPDGTGTGPSGTALRTWNGGACCGSAVRNNVDDVTFIRLLIQQLESRYPIDRSRVFAAGHSNGGILAYRLACEASDQIVGIGVQSTSLELDHCQPSQPVSLLHIHGTADNNIPIDGGRGTGGISGVSFQPPINGVKTIAAAGGCPATPVEATDPTNSDITTETWQPCGADTTVQFMKVAGASHAWMGHPGGAVALGGAPYTKLDSSLTIWTFLAGHPRR